MEASETLTPSQPPDSSPETPQALAPTPQTPAGDAASLEDGERDETGRSLSREAASYRRRLRETEAQRDALREQLDRIQTADVERIASASGLAVAGGVWQLGASLEALRSDDGTIDVETVERLVADILRDRPGLQTRPVGDVGIGRGGDALPTRGPKVGLSALLKPGGG
jgi:hypothetical protein